MNDVDRDILGIGAAGLRARVGLLLLRMRMRMHASTLALEDSKDAPGAQTPQFVRDIQGAPLKKKASALIGDGLASKLLLRAELARRAARERLFWVRFVELTTSSRAAQIASDFRIAMSGFCGWRPTMLSAAGYSPD